MKRVGVLYHPLKRSAVKLGKDLSTFLRSQGLAAWTCSAWETQTARSKMGSTDLVVTVGGDGTILRTAQAILPGKIPITGVNMGNVGFMTELAVSEARELLPRLIEGEGWIDERAVLEAEITASSGSESEKHLALNDVVMARGSVVRVVMIESSIDGKPLTTFKADGVIVSSATGSTGYAYAAGGPILHPHAQEMVMLPIMPHLSASFRLVLPPTSVVTLKLQAAYPCTASIDGHTNLPVSSGAAVVIRRSQHTARFLRIHPEGEFYATLEKRLKGKQ